MHCTVAYIIEISTNAMHSKQIEELGKSVDQIKKSKNPKFFKNPLHKRTNATGIKSLGHLGQKF